MQRDAPPSGEDKLIVPLPLGNTVADASVAVPVEVLRRELFGRQDSSSMIAHLEEKLLKDIKIGPWSQQKQMNDEGGEGGGGGGGEGKAGGGKTGGGDADSKILSESSEGGEGGEGEGGAMIRDVEYLLPASFGIAAMMVYEKQTIEINEDVNGGFVVRISAQAPDVTYGKSIHTLTQFVFEWVAPRSTRVRISW